MVERRARQGAERTRRRFARRQWARRWLTWRYVLGALGVLTVLGLGIYAVYFSSWLRAEGVEVEGTSLLTADEVLAAAAVETGGPLATVDLGAIESRVANVDAVASVDVSRQWPHDIVIEVVERTPVAVVDVGPGLRYVDATGAFFGEAPSGELPLIVRGGGADDDALAEAAAVVEALDETVAEMVAQIDVASVDRIELRLRDGRLVRWGSAEQSEQKAQVLLALLREEAEVYDVSVPGRPTTR